MAKIGIWDERGARGEGNAADLVSQREEDDVDGGDVAHVSYQTAISEERATVTIYKYLSTSSGECILCITTSMTKCIIKTKGCYCCFNCWCKMKLQLYRKSP
jgi:hypothetical protein